MHGRDAAREALALGWPAREADDGALPLLELLLLGETQGDTQATRPGVFVKRGCRIC